MWRRTDRGPSRYARHIRKCRPRTRLWSHLSECACAYVDRRQLDKQWLH